MSYYRTFATQYISFLERDAAMVRDEPLTLEQIKAYGEANSMLPLKIAHEPKSSKLK